MVEVENSLNPSSSLVWNTGVSGFGGNKVPGRSCVNTDPFRQGVQVTSMQLVAGEVCSRRNCSESDIIKF